MRSFGFAVDERDLGIAEARFAKKIEDFHLREAEPDVGVKVARLFERMALEIEDDDAAAGLENAGGFVDGLLRVEGVVEALGEERDVHLY